MHSKSFFYINFFKMSLENYEMCTMYTLTKFIRCIITVYCYQYGMKKSISLNVGDNLNYC